MAGHVFPPDAPRDRTNRGERTVHAALVHHLPDGWTAWNSLRVRGGGDWEGEGDFVVACPARGLLVLEVKNGRWQRF